MRGLHHPHAERRVPEAFLSLAAAKEGDCTQSRKAAKRPASIAHLILTPNANPEKTSSLCVFAPLRDPSFLATEDLAQSHKATKRSASIGRLISARQRKNETPFSFCDFVASCEPDLPCSASPRSRAYAEAVFALSAVATLCDPTLLAGHR